MDLLDPKYCEFVDSITVEGDLFRYPAFTVTVRTLPLRFVRSGCGVVRLVTVSGRASWLFVVVLSLTRFAPSRITRM